MKKLFWLSALLCLAAAAASAVSLAIDPAWSEVAFNVSNFGVHSVDGRFDTYTGKIEFDPQAPEKSMVHVAIEAASINTQTKARDKHLKTADFFDVTKYPQLTFESQTIEKTGDTYVMTGTLTIKGHAQPVKIPFTFTTTTTNGKTIVHAHGKTQIDRHDYGIDYGNNFSVGKMIDIDLSVAASE